MPHQTEFSGDSSLLRAGGNAELARGGGLASLRFGVCPNEIAMIIAAIFNHNQFTQITCPTRIQRLC